MEITYSDADTVSVAEAIDLLTRSTLGARRPIDHPEVIEGMLANATITVTARLDGRLIGMARTLTDFTYVAYLADLAVDVDFQRRGIGKRLIAETRRKLGPLCKIVLLSAPNANEYYPKLGFEHNPRAWVLSPREKS